MSVASVVQSADVLVVCGSGGVGKTTTAAALARQVVRRADMRVLVLTVDPARRLADAFGLGATGNAVVEVPVPDGKGTLFASMLDAKASWDELVHRYAPNAEQREIIMASPLYRSITERFVQSHDYIAMERLFELRTSGDYDLIVIDTPPANHAVDFLEAPQRMADFFESRVLKFLIAPNRSRLMNLTAKPFLQIADRVLGATFLADISEFFTALETMRPGFIERANAVNELLHRPSTQFIVVTTSQPAPRREAESFLSELETRELHRAGVIFNRVLPTFTTDDRALALAHNMLSANDTDPVERRVHTTVADNYVRLHALASAEQAERGVLTGASNTPILAEVPLMMTANEEYFDRIGDALWPKGAV